MKIINLTQHSATEEQKEAGVFDIQGEHKATLVKLLNFEDLPNAREIRERANQIADLAEQYNPDWAMIGGAPFLSSALERSLRAVGITPVYAFSVRESVEEIIDGHVIKRSIFKHQGLIHL